MKKIIAIALVSFSFNAFAQSTTPVSPVTPAPKPVKPFIYQPKATDTVYGSESAPVTIVEYASLSCPHCAHFLTTTLPDLKKKFIETGKVKLVYRDFPLNEPALKAAVLVQCVEKDRREVFIKVLFTTQSKWAYGGNFSDALASIAQLGGLPRDKFDACMANKQLETSILEVEKEASDTFGVSSTPAFFINNAPYKKEHDIATMGKAIEEVLGNK